MWDLFVETTFCGNNVPCSMVVPQLLRLSVNKIREASATDKTEGIHKLRKVRVLRREIRSFKKKFVILRNQYVV